MKPTLRPFLAPKYSLAFWGLTIALLLGGCSQEPAGSPNPSQPSPADQAPPTVGPPSQAQPAPADKVLKVVKDKRGRHIARVVQRGDKRVVLRDGRPGTE